MKYPASLIPAKDGTLLSIWERGRGYSPITCVLIHGSGEGGYVWGPTCRGLQTRCSFVGFDLRGHGDSQRSPTGRYELASHVSDVTEIIRYLALKKIVLIGHSLGGLIAMHVASGRCSEQVAGVILVDAVPEPRPEGMRQATANLLASFRVWESIESFKESLLKTQPMLSAAIAEELALGALKQTPRGFEMKLDPAFADQRQHEAEREDFREMQRAFSAIACPTLLVRGAASAIVSAAAASRSAAQLRRGRLVTIPSAGHAVMSDNPAAFVGCVGNFLEPFLQATTRRERIS